jgi:predicted ATPase/DNA-binding CsgD family transcriptional regulator
LQPSIHMGAQPVRWPLRPARRYGLPPLASTLVGRDSDRLAATQILVDQGARLVTLAGPPGVGKTSLALAVAESIQDQYEHGAAFVDLSLVRDPRLVLDTIAQTFGLRQQGNLTPADQLDGYLQDMSLLLVLDNLEHVIEASPHIAELLAHARGLSVLATSRAVLRLRSERVYHVAPLTAGSSFDMFVERSRAVRADFVCAPSEVPIVRAICARLDHLPLAIELAAARSLLLSPAELLDRISRRLVLLTDPPRDAAARHRTMRDAIEWSYELLSADERALLRRLSVFAGGFTLETAEAMFTPANGTTLECLSNLVRVSLLRRETASGNVPETRFRLLETVREYAWERLLASGEAEGSQQAHADFWCQYVEEHYPLNFGPEQSAYGARLEREHANLRQALSWSIDTYRFDVALRLAGGLHWFWYSRGYLAEGLRWVTLALEPGSAESPAARAVAARAAGALALNLGKFTEAIAWLDLAVSLGRKRPANRLAQAELAMALGIRAVTRIATGQYADAEASVRESLAVFESLEDHWGIATAREVLGAIAALRGEAELAERLASEALAFHRSLGSRENIARALDVLGYASALRGQLARAESCFEESLSLRRAAPNRPATAAVLARLGLVAYLGQHWQRAATYYRESLALAQEVGDAAGVVRCLGQIAALGLACGLDRREVARLGSAVQHHQRALRLPSPPVEQVAARRLAQAVRAEMSGVGLAAAWLGGRALNMADAARLGAALLERIAANGSDSSGQGVRLAPREKQVAVLIAQGLTNRQIAEELVVAQRTVDTYVERLLAKLSFTTRAQIAAWIASQGMLPPQDR